MDNVNNEVVEFYKKLGYTLIEIKSSVFREEESTLVFQTDNKNHTVDGSTILYDHAVALHHQLQKARERLWLEANKLPVHEGRADLISLLDLQLLLGITYHSDLDQDKK